MRDVPVRGFLTELESVIVGLRSQGVDVSRLVLTPSALEPELHPETMLMLARRLGLAASRMPSLGGGEEALRLTPINVEDLLLRPSVKIDYRRLEHFIRGKTSWSPAVAGRSAPKFAIGSSILAPDRLLVDREFGAGIARSPRTAGGQIERQR